MRGGPKVWAREWARGCGRESGREGGRGCESGLEGGLGSAGRVTRARGRGRARASQDACGRLEAEGGAARAQHACRKPRSNHWVETRERSNSTERRARSTPTRASSFAHTSSSSTSVSTCPRAIRSNQKRPEAITSNHKQSQASRSKQHCMPMVASRHRWQARHQMPGTQRAAGGEALAGCHPPRAALAAGRGHRCACRGHSCEAARPPARPPSRACSSQAVSAR